MSKHSRPDHVTKQNLVNKKEQSGMMLSRENVQNLIEPNNILTTQIKLIQLKKILLNNNVKRQKVTPELTSI
jgi:ribosomal protein L17